MAEFGTSSPEQDPALLNLARAMAVRDQTANIIETVQAITELSDQLPEPFSDDIDFDIVIDGAGPLADSATAEIFVILKDIAAETGSSEPYRALPYSRQESLKSLISTTVDDEATASSIYQLAEEFDEAFNLPSGDPGQSERVRSGFQQRLARATAVAQKNGVRVEEVFERDDLYRELIRNQWRDAADCASALAGFINKISSTRFYDIFNPFVMSIETVEKKAQAEGGDMTLSPEGTMEIIAKLGALLENDETFKARVEQTVAFSKAVVCRVLAKRLENTWGDTATITLPADIQSAFGGTQLHQEWPESSAGDEENGLEYYVEMMGGWANLVTVLALDTLMYTSHHI